jgi:hypothetical protein
MTPHQAHAHKLDASQVDEIAQLLALAFENGSGLSQICNAEGEELHRRLHLLFRAGLALQAAANQLVLSVTQDDLVTGVAVMQEPESCFPLWAQIHWLLQVSFGISPVVAWHLWQSLRILERHHPPEPHYYLMLLGVHPNFQRKDTLALCLRYFMHVQKHIPHQLVCIWKQEIRKMWRCTNTLGIT